MLVLTRKKDDVILIGDNIRILICSIRKGEVRIGIKADKSVIIQREDTPSKNKIIVYRRPADK